MPDSYGKRQRDVVKARKAAAREERRIARRRRHDGLEVAEWAEPTGNSEAQAQEGDGVQEGEEADLDSAHASDAVDSQ
jgi:hypothetical protein